MALETASEQNFGARQIGEALSEAGLEFNHPIRAALEEAAVIVSSGRDVSVRVHGQSLTDAIKTLRKDPKFAGSFGAPAKEVDHRDFKTMSANFTDIATGKIVVK